MSGDVKSAREGRRERGQLRTAEDSCGTGARPEQCGGVAGTAGTVQQQLPRGDDGIMYFVHVQLTA